ncbi:ThiF family adenylyltransferase [Aurantimonas marianensis]|uniref:ThiF family adenylyltransferase n=1 Tax=Aurantimonas marianensis TaxID=2920428 RepID=A0A9X2H4Q7_9HYPH|nr:ThiF family adenylyltransferase [Aurantimonas marianensis]MCP3053750.1 ThiF family adenylyltransferase [Aurantimonas marianensis]
MTLADLLHSNLEKALKGTGDEDPQGEPMEVWWNDAQRNETGNFLLVDSTWDLTGFEKGVAEVAFRCERINEELCFRGVIEKIWAGSREEVLYERTFQAPPIPGALRTIATWRRNDTLPLPNQGQLAGQLPGLDYKGRHEQTSFGSLRVSLTVKRTELRHEAPGDGFVCLLTLSRGSKNKRREQHFVIPVFRAGEEDLGYRVPATKVLRRSHIALIGLGALGSPLALELARNGVEHLRILDHDIVEPGNTVRWALGASAWGKRKTTALEQFIQAEYPRTTVTSSDVFIGVGSGRRRG